MFLIIRDHFTYMCELGRLWEKYKDIVLQQALALIFIIVGLLFFDAGWILGMTPAEVTSKLPVFSLSSNVLIAVGITVIFFGVSTVQTNFVNYNSKKDITIINSNLDEILIEIRTRANISEISSPDTESHSEASTDTPRNSNQETQRKRIDQITLELNLESMVLTAVSVASAVEVGFIGILGPFDIRTITLSILFVGLIIWINCQYKIKMNEIREIFEN